MKVHFIVFLLVGVMVFMATCDEESGENGNSNENKSKSNEKSGSNEDSDENSGSNEDSDENSDGDEDSDSDEDNDSDEKSTSEESRSSKESDDKSQDSDQSNESNSPGEEECEAAVVDDEGCAAPNYGSQFWTQCNNACPQNWCDGSDVVEVICTAACGLECVQNYLAKNACCRPVTQSKDEISVVHNMDFPLLSLNLTTISFVDNLKHLSSTKLEKFYKTACGLVLIVKLPQLQSAIPDSLFAFYDATGGYMTPVVEKGTATCDYRDVTLTISLPLNANECISYGKLQCASVSAFSDAADWDLLLDDRLLNSQYPIVTETLQNLPLVKGEVLQEIWSVKGRLLAQAVVQTQLCDFGTSDPDSYDATALQNIFEYRSEENEVVEPCAGAGDVTACALEFIAARSASCRVARPDNAPLYRTNINVQAQKCHASLLRNGYDLYNLTASVENFTWNKGTGILALSLKFHGAFFHSHSSELTVYQIGEAPVKETGYTTARYAPELNVIIPVGRGEDIMVDWKALSAAFVTSAFPEGAWFDFDPRLEHSTKPAIAEAVECLRDNKALVSRQVFDAEGPSFFYMWLQKYLNFGVPAYCGDFHKHVHRY